MDKILQEYPRTWIIMNHTTLRKGIGWGLLSGLVATLVMDLILIGIFAAAGMPALTCYSLIGDTLARFLSIQGGTVSDSIRMGIVAHYLIGPLIGASFGAIAAKVDLFRTGSRKKMILYAILYAEILSQPLLALTPILLRMTLAATLQWFGGAMLMHLIWGFGMGAMLSQWLRRLPAAN